LQERYGGSESIGAALPRVWPLNLPTGYRTDSFVLAGVLRLDGTLSGKDATTGEALPTMRSYTFKVIVETDEH